MRGHESMQTDEGEAEKRTLRIVAGTNRGAEGGASPAPTRFNTFRELLVELMEEKFEEFVDGREREGHKERRSEGASE